jgi:multiple sugar transport system permease protein
MGDVPTVSHSRAQPYTIGRRSLNLRQREAAFGFLFILPWIVGFVVFTAGPMLASLALSFTDWSIFGTPHWIGLSNYRTLIKDHFFWTALRVTVVFTIVSVPLDILGSLALALLLDRPFKGRGLARALFYLPELAPGVATAILWLWVYNTHFGILNYLFSLVGLSAVPWLENPTWVIPSFVILSLWTIGGSRMIIFLAGLQGIPRDLLDAAQLDGAGWLSRFWRVTVPMLSPVIFFNLLLTTIGAFQVFTSAYVMTGGGPASASLFYVLYLYQNAFQYMKMGYAAALAWVLFAILLAFTALQFRLMRDWVYYEGGGPS